MSQALKAVKDIPFEETKKHMDELLLLKLKLEKNPLVAGVSIITWDDVLKQETEDEID